ncbi:hypothetical protein LIER_20581 [Lithospermum erythrorhizon]|uniref:Uncharacterized protein n=1 Tax=Lithospermum erythrorhizon TaxID=34254 RepID=A0AAV3QQ45_LITER
MENFGLDVINREYWTEEIIIMHFERETRMAMELSLDENGLPNDLQRPSTENIITDRYYEDSAIVRNSLHAYYANSGTKWTEDWDEILNIAGYEQGNSSLYNFEPNLDSGSSSRRRRSSGSDNIWLSRRIRGRGDCKRSHSLETLDGTSGFTKKRRFERLPDEAGTSETQVNYRGIGYNMGLPQDKGKRIMDLSEQVDEETKGDREQEETHVGNQ